MYSRISIVFFYVLGPLFILRCSLQGMGRKVIPVCSSVVEMTIKVLSATILVPRLAYFGVALTEPISWVCMTILLTGGLFREAAGTDVAKVRLKWYNKHYIGCVHTNRNNAENTL